MFQHLNIRLKRANIPVMELRAAASAEEAVELGGVRYISMTEMRIQINFIDFYNL